MTTPMHVFKSIIDPSPLVQAKKVKNGYVWLATKEQAEEIKGKGLYVAVMELACKLHPKTGEKIPNGHFFSFLGCEKNPAIFTEIPKEVLEDE